MNFNLILETPKKTYIFFLVITFIFFGNTIKNSFSLDDSYITVTNYPIEGQFYKPNQELVSQGISAIPKIWQSTYAHDGESNFDYRPLVTSMFAIEYSIFGQNPHVNHFINIILYSIICYLVFLFTKQLIDKTDYSNSNLFALVCALIFLVHPSHSEVVNNIKCRDELLVSVCGFLAAIKTFKYFETKQIKYLIFGIILISLGFFAKLSMGLFLFTIPLSLYFFQKTSIKTTLISFAIIFLCFQFYNLIKELSVSEVEIRNLYRFENPLYTDNISSITQLFFSITSLGFYIKLLLLPYPLCYYYGSNMLNPNEPFSVYFLISVVTIIIAAAYFYKTKNKLFLYGILFFGLSLSPLLNLQEPVAGIVGERLGFIASYGFIFAVTSVIISPKINSFSLINKKIKISFFVLLGISLIYNFNRNNAWETKLSLFENDSINLKNSAKANSLLANEYFEILFLNKQKENTKKLTPPQLAELCVKHYNLAIKADSSIFSCYNNLGVVYYSYYNNIEQAEKNFLSAIAAKPQYPQAYENLGNCYKKAANINLASKAYIKSISQNNKQYTAYLELIRLYFNEKKYEQTLALINVSLKQFPNDYEILVEKGNAYMMQGKLDTCLIYFEQAYEINKTKRLAGFLNSKYLNLNDTTKALFYKNEYEQIKN